jgi:heme/copper-type cytochrome/quinol oxidase subunit 3
MANFVNQSSGPTESAEEREYEFRALISSIWTGGRLFIGIYTFMLSGLVFSYFYLRSSNNGLLWRPDHVTGPRSFGLFVFGLSLATSILAYLGRKRLVAGSFTDFNVAAWTGVTTGLLALLLQILEFSHLGFYPGSSGYASCFVGFCVMNIMTLLIAAYWLETTVARGMRIRKELPGDNPEFSSHPRARAFRADVAAMTYFQLYVALTGALLFAMFYLM